MSHCLFVPDRVVKSILIELTVQRKSIDSLSVTSVLSCESYTSVYKINGVVQCFLVIGFLLFPC